MTRDFNKQRRDDARPFSRNQPSNRRGEERSFRPARPRLNRETVDRGWETGAPPRHADYHTSTNTNGRPSRNTQGNSRSSNYNGRNSYGNRQENKRGFERTPNSSRPSSFGSDRRQFGPQSSRPSYGSHSPQSQSRPSNERRGYSDRPREYGNRPGFDHQDNRRPYGQRNQFGQGDRDQRREGPRSFDRDNRSPRNFDRNSRPPRRFDHDSRPPQAHQSQHREAPNPRWQSRPTTFNRQYGQSQRDEHPSQQEQFEGDYERFGSAEQAVADRPYRKHDRDQQANGKEAQVTRLPDGRVLKGPKAVQRKNAEFWTDISQDTEKLVPKPTEENAPKAARKARTRSASAVARTRKGTAKEGKAKHQGKILKPSQRGFKWPTS